MSARLHRARQNDDHVLSSEPPSRVQSQAISIRHRRGRPLTPVDKTPHAFAKCPESRREPLCSEGGA
jgi:hypothetical protein